MPKTKSEKPSKNVDTNVTRTSGNHSEISKEPNWKPVNDSLGPTPMNVILYGIDSVSRLSLRRYMPDVFATLQKHDAIDLKGYNKVGLNTYPNLMPILTGRPGKDIRDAIKDRHKAHDNVPFIWKNFSSNNYITMYAEDTPDISSFNYKKLGFVKQPTDFYLRPVFMAAQKHIAYGPYSNRYFCFRDKNVAQLMVEYLIDYAKSFWHQPWFGMFWTNALTHDDLQYGTTSEDALKNLIKSYDERSEFNNSILIFFSDHGLRFGSFRQKTHMGKYEDSLPFNFIMVPKWFQKVYPEAYKNLKTNEQRLTTPYDVYATLIDILTGRLENRKKSKVETIGTSLFDEIREDRTCDMAKIPAEFCVGDVFLKFDKEKTIFKDLMSFVLKSINKEMRKFNGCVQFTDYSLIKVMKVIKRTRFPKKEDDIKTDKKGDFLVKFQLAPGEGVFEATVSVINNKFKILGEISRLNRYGNQSHCISDSYYSRICFCEHQL